MRHFWFGWFEILLHLLVLGVFLPYLYSVANTELNLLGYFVLGLLITQDYFIVKYYHRKLKK